MKPILWLVPFLIFAFPSAHGKIYKCTNAKGKIEYTDSPCANELHQQTYDNAREAIFDEKKSTPVTASALRSDDITLDAFIEAVKKQAFNDVRFMLSKNSGLVVAQDKNGLTPLHHAAKHALLEMTRLLIKNGAVVDAITHAGRTPLMLVTMNGENQKEEMYHKAAEVADYLIEQGANIRAVDNNGQPVLYYTAFYGNSLVLEKLIAKGVTASTPLKKSTALHVAAWTGHINVMELLIENGANVNKSDANGQSPIYGAAWTNKLDVAKFLYNKGAKLRKWGITPLHVAAKHGHKEVSEFFIQEGIKVNAMAENGGPIHQAAWTGKADYIHWLIGKGADVNLQDERGNTALHTAASWNQAKVIRILLNMRANKGLKNEQGQTALDIAKLRQYKDIVAILK
tara:strand:- start:5515 stop:6711 length:1197 start_codon:yes stop_codon:yes gene_type:complete